MVKPIRVVASLTPILYIMDIKGANGDVLSVGQCFISAGASQELSLSILCKKFGYIHKNLDTYILGMMDEFIRWPKLYLLLSTTCDEIL